MSHYLCYSGVFFSVCFKKERACILEKSSEISERGSYSQGRRVGSALSVEPNKVRHSDGHLMLSPYSYYYAVTTSNLHKSNDTVTSVLLARQTVVQRHSFTSIPTSVHDIPWTTPPAVYKKALWKRFRHTGFSLNSLPSVSRPGRRESICRAHRKEHVILFSWWFFILSLSCFSLKMHEILYSMFALIQICYV